MGVYFLIFILLFVTALFFDKYTLMVGNVKFEKEKCFLVFATIVLSLLSGLRNFSVGTDTQDYANSFVTTDFKYETYEMFSKLFVDVIRFFTHSPTAYLIICALFINGLILFAIYRMSNDKKYSVFIYITLLFYFTSFNALRQAMAYAIILNGVYYIRESKWAKYAIVLIVATLFHKSAAIGVLYFLTPLINCTSLGQEKDSTKNIKKGYSIIRVACMAIFATLFVVVEYTYFDEILQYGGQFFPDYQVYLYNEFRYIEGGIQQVVVYTAIFLCFLFFVPSNAKYKNMFMVPLTAAVMFAFASMKMAYIVRFMYYFDISIVLAIPYMFDNNMFSERTNKIFKLVITFGCVAFFVYGLLNNYMRVADYKFFWEM